MFQALTEDHDSVKDAKAELEQLIAYDNIVLRVSVCVSLFLSGTIVSVSMCAVIFVRHYYFSLLFLWVYYKFMLIVMMPSSHEKRKAVELNELIEEEKRQREELEVWPRGSACVPSFFH